MGLSAVLLPTASTTQRKQKEMLQRLFCFLALFTSLRLDLILSSDADLVLIYGGGSGEDVDLVLLSDTGGGGGRVRRESAANNESEVLDQTGEEMNLSRGYTQPNEFLKDVDISEDAIKSSVQKNNLTTNEDNDTKYYQTDFIESGLIYFQDLDKANKSGPHMGKVQEHPMLSKSYRRAATISLKFKFPFYGHEVENITIATGGFLYTGDYVHSWLAATQYIAPLMANFDTSNNHEAKIRYLDTGDHLIVEWKDVYLQEREKEGPFTFQVTLNKTGDIQFAYQDIPLAITTIQDEDHPVKVGLSDAYIIDRTIFFVRRKTIYEYHRVNMKHQNISSHSAIVFKALFTCNKQKTCDECLSKSRGGGPSSMVCGWCPSLNRCSDGMDRNRQDWLTHNCDKNNISDLNSCHTASQIIPSSGAAEETSRAAISSDISTFQPQGPAINPGGLAALIIVLVLVVSLVGWTTYAYFTPHTWSGQLLIKYRPGAWRWRQGGARYTAASIHM